MSTAMANSIRSEVLKYLREAASPMAVSAVAKELRSRPELSTITDSDVRNVVRPLIVTGKVSLSTGLKIQIGQEQQAVPSR